eukprot:1190145-Prorocentrum_minimum.AAC.4
MGSKAGSAPWRPAGRRAALRGSRCWRAGRASGAERRAAGRSGRRAPRASCAARCCCWRQYAGRKPAGSARAARARPCAPGTTGPGRLRRSTSPGGPHAWRLFASSHSAGRCGQASSVRCYLPAGEIRAEIGSRALETLEAGGT